MFEEELHGVGSIDEEAETPSTESSTGLGGHEKDSSVESASAASVDEEDRAKKL